MKLVKPPRLNVKDPIGIVASSKPVFPSHKDNYERGKKEIYDLGFRIKEGRTIGQQRWWMAGIPKDVANDINSMFADSSIKAIIAHTGGYSAISVVEYLDFELITKNPKPFIGMSDMTVYHWAIISKTGQVGFHMDDLSYGFGRELKTGQEEWPELNRRFFLDFLTKSTAPGVVKPITEWEEWKAGQAEGRLVGGILQRISVLAGTQYFPSLEYFDGAILFWEEIGVELPQIYQQLHQLKLMGVFDRISGMLIGKLKYLKPQREEMNEPTPKEMILDILNDYNFPIMANMDFGHFTVNIPMPIGCKASFDTSKFELNFLESAVV